jgi:hypothetical protein
MNKKHEVMQVFMDEYGITQRGMDEFGISPKYDSERDYWYFDGADMYRASIWAMINAGGAGNILPMLLSGELEP